MGEAYAEFKGMANECKTLLRQAFMAVGEDWEISKRVEEFITEMGRAEARSCRLGISPRGLAIRIVGTDKEEILYRKYSCNAYQLKGLLLDLALLLANQWNGELHFEKLDNGSVATRNEDEAKGRRCHGKGRQPMVTYVIERGWAWERDDNNLQIDGENGAGNGEVERGP